MKRFSMITGLAVLALLVCSGAMCSPLGNGAFFPTTGAFLPTTGFGGGGFMPGLFNTTPVTPVTPGFNTGTGFSTTTGFPMTGFTTTPGFDTTTPGLSTGFGGMSTGVGTTTGFGSSMMGTTGMGTFTTVPTPGITGGF